MPKDDATAPLFVLLCTCLAALIQFTQARQAVPPLKMRAIEEDDAIGVSQVNGENGRNGGVNQAALPPKMKVIKVDDATGASRAKGKRERRSGRSASLRGSRRRREGARKTETRRNLRNEIRRKRTRKKNGGSERGAERCVEIETAFKPSFENE